MDPDDAIDQLAAYLNLTPEAISIAEGWSILPVDMQAHFSLLLDDYIAQQSPILDDLYKNASRQHQARFNRIIERIQDEKRGIPPEDA